MREILLRGKRIDSGEWIFGSLLFQPEDEFMHGSYICQKISAAKYDDGNLLLGGFVEVIPETVGQYTGLTDKNGDKIFEGDILKWDEKEWGKAFSEIVAWDYELLNMRQHDWPQFCEIIGNIYDSPELLNQ